MGQWLEGVGESREFLEVFFLKNRDITACLHTNGDDLKEREVHQYRIGELDIEIRGENCRSTIFL